jgi:hypothetical protein
MRRAAISKAVNVFAHTALCWVHAKGANAGDKQVVIVDPLGAGSEMK